MKYHIDNSKKAIETKQVFVGLAVDDVEKWKAEFLRECYNLAIVPDYMPGQTGYVIYSIENETFIFWLINFTGAAGRAGAAAKITERILQKIAGPICKETGAKKIKCTVERLGMARKLKNFGFEQQPGTNIFIGAAKNVF